MSSKTLAIVVCIGALALACQTAQGPVTPTVKPAGRPDIVLRAPHLEYIPCEERVSVIWENINQPHGTKIYVDAVYYDVRSEGMPKRHEITSAREVSRQSLVNGAKNCGSCKWNVPAIECDMSVLEIRFVRGGKTVYGEEFIVGCVQPRQQHAGPRQELAP